MSDVVQLHCSYRHPLKRAEGVKQGDFQFRCLGRRDLKGTPSHPLPRGEGAYLHGQHLGSAPGREIAARHFPGGAQPLVAVRAAQGAVLLFVTPFARAAPIRERRGSSFPPRCRRTGLKFARDPSRNDQLGIRVSPVANAWSAGRSRRPGSSFFLSNLGKQALGNF